MFILYFEAPSHFAERLRQQILTNVTSAVPSKEKIVPFELPAMERDSHLPLITIDLWEELMTDCGSSWLRSRSLLNNAANKHYVARWEDGCHSPVRFTPLAESELNGRRRSEH
jgi:hypothetical protein